MLVWSILPIFVSVGAVKWALNERRKHPDQDDITEYAWAILAATIAWQIWAFIFVIPWPEIMKD